MQRYRGRPRFHGTPIGKSQLHLTGNIGMHSWLREYSQEARNLDEARARNDYTSPCQDFPEEWDWAHDGELKVDRLERLMRAERMCLTCEVFVECLPLRNDPTLAGVVAGTVIAGPQSGIPRAMLDETLAALRKRALGERSKSRRKKAS